MKTNKGYTVPELMITVAIIGTVTAISIPCYFRIRMEVNMEMVKQHMRVIGEKMSEIFNNKKAYPEQAKWPDNLDQNDEEEQAITANLNSIDMLGYTKGDYTVNQTRSEYILRCCPKPEEMNKAGNKCFVVHADSSLSGNSTPGVVLAVDASSALGLPLVQYGNIPLLPNPDLPLGIYLQDLGAEQKTQLVSAYLETLAYSSDVFANDPSLSYCQPMCGSTLYSQASYVFLPDGGLTNASFAPVWQDAVHNLESKGIELYMVKREMNPDLKVKYLDYESSSYTLTNPNEVYEVTFKLNDRVETVAEAQDRTAAPNAVIDGYFTAGCVRTYPTCTSPY